MRLHNFSLTTKIVSELLPANKFHDYFLYGLCCQYFFPSKMFLLLMAIVMLQRQSFLQHHMLETGLEKYGTETSSQKSSTTAIRWSVSIVPLKNAWQVDEKTKEVNALFNKPHNNQSRIVSLWNARKQTKRSNSWNRFTVTSWYIIGN